MNKYFKLVAICFIVLNLVLSGCGPGQAFGPTVTPIPTSTSVPTPTLVPTSTSTPTQMPTATDIPTITPTVAFTPTPVQVCNPGAVVTSGSDNSLPGYVDIIQASTKLEGNRLFVTLTLRDFPEKIKITNPDGLPPFVPEYEWGVDIDIDNNPATGNVNNFSVNTLGVEYFMHTGYFRWQTTKTELPLKTAIIYVGVGQLNPPYWPTGKSNTTKVLVDIKQKTITFNGVIPNINKDSHLTFYSKQVVSANETLFKTLCYR
jgi:hypothetical protein